MTELRRRFLGGNVGVGAHCLRSALRGDEDADEIAANAGWLILADGIYATIALAKKL